MRVRRFLLALPLWSLVVAAPPLSIAASLEPTRTLVLSLQGIDAGGCFRRIDAELKKVRGVKATAYDTRTVEVRVVATPRVEAPTLLAAVERAGYLAIAGPGSGRWMPPAGFPEGSDVGIVSEAGADVPSLDSLAVPGKVTLVDFYADWCGPCRMIDRHLLEVLHTRSDLAVRKINIVNWSSEVVKRRFAKIDGIPYMIVYGKKGAQVGSLVGYRPQDLDQYIERGAEQ
jgi:thiol-disulfide isomerase/thioredoxin/copper chaperone CopZ